MSRITSFIFAVMLGAAFPAPALTAGGASAQCRGRDTTVVKPLRFARGRTTGVVRDTIRLCTSHEYRLRARAGQQMTVHLATQGPTSFTIYGPSGALEGADGVGDWAGDLPDDGQYTIAIGTDATARYTLEVTIR